MPHRTSESLVEAIVMLRRLRMTAAVGWEYVHVCVDDATRLAYAEVLPDEKATSAVAFLRRALASTAVMASAPSAS